MCENAIGVGESFLFIHRQIVYGENAIVVGESFHLQYDENAIGVRESFLFICRQIVYAYGENDIVVSVSFHVQANCVWRECHGVSESFLFIRRQIVYGENAIDIDVKSYWKLLIEEVSDFSTDEFLFPDAFWSIHYVSESVVPEKIIPK